MEAAAATAAVAWGEVRMPVGVVQPVAGGEEKLFLPCPLLAGGEGGMVEVRVRGAAELRCCC